MLNQTYAEFISIFVFQNLKYIYAIQVFHLLFPLNECFVDMLFDILS